MGIQLINFRIFTSFNRHSLWEWEHRSPAWRESIREPFYKNMQTAKWVGSCSNNQYFPFWLDNPARGDYDRIYDRLIRLLLKINFRIPSAVFCENILLYRCGILHSCLASIFCPNKGSFYKLLQSSDGQFNLINLDDLSISGQRGASPLVHPVTLDQAGQLDSSGLNEAF